jgi:hypothetical protein
MERTKGAKETMDAACKTAWANRLDVGPIIRREMYARLRDASFAIRPEYETVIESDPNSQFG